MQCLLHLSEGLHFTKLYKRTDDNLDCSDIKRSEFFPYKHTQGREGEKQKRMYDHHGSIPQAWCLVVKNDVTLEEVSCCYSTCKSMGIPPIILGRGKSSIATLMILHSLVKSISLIANHWVSKDFQSCVYAVVRKLHIHASPGHTATLKHRRKSAFSLFFSVKNEHIKTVKIYTIRLGSISCMHLDSAIQSWLLFKPIIIF